MPLPYNPDAEVAIFDRLRRVHAPTVPPLRVQPPRDAADAAERALLVEFGLWNAAHDLLIVQATAHAIDHLFAEVPAMQFALARQLGDDAAHAEVSRARIAALSGRDQLPEIEALVRHHWQLLGDLPFQNWQSFLAWELHYEHHILARLLVNRRTAQVVDIAVRDYAEKTVRVDEEVHRSRIANWWIERFNAGAETQRTQWREEILAADERLQQRLNPYLRDAWALNIAASKIDGRGHVPLYDAWRAEMLGLLLDVAPEKLTGLTSLAA